MIVLEDLSNVLLERFDEELCSLRALGGFFVPFVPVECAYLFGLFRKGERFVLGEKEVAAEDASQWRPTDLIVAVAVVVLYAIGLQRHLVLADYAVNQHLEHKVPRLLLEPVIDFGDLVAQLVQLINEPVCRNLDIFC